jgi:hypothetical protein
MLQGLRDQIDKYSGRGNNEENKASRDSNSFIKLKVKVSCPCALTESASSSGLFTPRERDSDTLNRSLSDPQSRSGRGEEINSQPLPRLEPLHHPARISVLYH